VTARTPPREADDASPLPPGDPVRPARLIAACTLLSRVLGLARDMLMAAVLGAGPVMDAFVLAFTVPNLFRRLFGEGALSTAFIPVFAEYDEQPGRDARRLLSVCFTWLATVLGALALALGLVCLVVLLAAPSLGLPPKAQLFVALLEILLPYLPFICLSALLAGALQVRGHFLVPAMAPVVLNVFWIAGLVLLVRPLGTAGVAVAIVAGGLAQLAWHLAAVRRRGVAPRLDLDPHHEGLHRVKGLLGPVVLGLAAMQINVLLDRLIAEACVPGDGANAALYYGNRLMQLPLGVFGLAIATASFPAFARSAAREDIRGLVHALRRSLRWVLFISLPCTAITLALAGPIVQLLFGRGAFLERAGGDAVSRTASVLGLYILGLGAYGAVHVLSRAFYALQDTRTPVRIAMAMTGLNLALNLALVWPMREAGLALATAVSATGNALWLARRLRRRFKASRRPEVSASAVRSLVGAVLAAIVCSVALDLTAEVAGEGAAAEAMRVFVPMALALGVYFAAARLMQMHEPRELLGALRRRSRASEEPPV